MKQQQQQQQQRQQQQRRNTHQRDLVYQAILALAGTHPTATQVYDYVHAHDKKVSLATVYRNLGLLANEEKILSIETSVSRHYDDRTDDHAHVVCLHCGKMVDVGLPYDGKADAAVARASGYTDVTHRTVYEGLCPACQ